MITKRIYVFLVLVVFIFGLSACAQIDKTLSSKFTLNPGSSKVRIQTYLPEADSPYFCVTEFNQVSIEDLCDAINKTITEKKVDILLDASPRSIDWLNTLLEVPDLDKKLKATSDNQSKRHKSKDFSGLSKSKQDNIRKHNRRFLEKNYSQTPKCSNNENTCNKEKAIILIHGIGGTNETFGNLPEYLYNNYCLDTNIYLADYWSNIALPNFRSLFALGKELKDSISKVILKNEKNGNIKDVSIIAHSQGGLLAQYAIVDLAKEFNSINFHLLLFAVPSLGAKAAEFSQKLLYPVDKAILLSNYINPVSYCYSPTIWNRQAYDMKPESIFLRDIHQRIQVARRDGTLCKVTVSDVCGTYSLYGVKELNDSIVGFESATYGTRGGKDKNNRFLVPYRHFDDIVNVVRRDHYSYTLIKSLMSEDDHTEDFFKVPENKNYMRKDFRGGFGFADIYFCDKKFYKRGKTYCMASFSPFKPINKPSFESKDTFRNILTKSSVLQLCLLPKTLLDVYGDIVTEFQIQDKITRNEKNSSSIEPPLSMHHFVLAQKDKIENDEVPVFSVKILKIKTRYFWFPKVLCSDEVKLKVYVKSQISVDISDQETLINANVDDVIYVLPRYEKKLRMIKIEYFRNDEKKGTTLWTICPTGKRFVISKGDKCNCKRKKHLSLQ